MSKTGDEKVHERVDLDTILVNEIGQFGRFQCRVLALAVAVVMFTAWGSGEHVFTTARIATRCLIPECDPEQPQFSPDWLGNAVPSTQAGSFDNCQRFSSADPARAVASATCPATLFDNQTLEPCEGYVYQNTHSVVYDFGLACDEWRRTLIASLRPLGTISAMPFVGLVSDRWGRRVPLAISGFNTAWLGILRYWAGTYVGFIVSEVAESTFGAGTYSCVYILLMELVGPKYRIVTGAALSSSYALGQITMGFLAWAVPDWRRLTLLLYVPQLIVISYWWVMAESVRWCMSKGRYEESETLLQKTAKVNGTKLSSKSLEGLRLTAEKERNEKETKDQVQEPWLVVLVFRHKRVLVRCLVLPVCWITTTFIYYGMSINSVNISGHRYLNYISVASAEIPGYWLAVFLIGRVGRKPVLIAAFWTCAASQVAYVFLPTELYGLSLTMYMIATSSIAMVMVSLYLYTIELYPTRYRHTLFAFSSTIAKIGTTLAPLTPAMGADLFEEFPFVLFGGLAFLSGCLLSLLPETRGTRLPDTMAQADQLGATAAHA